MLYCKCIMQEFYNAVTLQCFFCPGREHLHLSLYLHLRLLV